MRRVSCLAIAVLCCSTAMAGAEQNPQPPQDQTPAAAAGPGGATGANQAPGGEVQPQVWPPAQNGAPAPSGPAAEQGQAQLPETIAKDGRIHLDVVVTDKAGHAIPGLKRGDFTLLDRGQPRKIDSFEALGDRDAHGNPVQVVMAVDLVNIGFDRVAVSRQYMAKFLRQNGGRLAHPVSIVWLTDTGLQQQLGPSLDGNALAAQLEATKGQLRMLNRAAGAWGAIERFELSSQMLDQLVTAMGRFPGRKLLIWIGPGWPMLDNPNMEVTWNQEQRLFHNMVDLTTKIREAQVEICSVTEGMPDFYTFLYRGFLKGVKKPGQIYLPNLSLKVMAIWSGGQVQAPSNDLARAIALCVQDADAYYRISFTPPPADGPDEYHELKVKLNKPGLTARTSQMYYNQPPGHQAEQQNGGKPGDKYKNLAQPR